MIIQDVSNSMIFPCMEVILVIFQVFYDFQSLWEPCYKEGMVILRCSMADSNMSRRKLKCVTARLSQQLTLEWMLSVPPSCPPVTVGVAPEHLTD